jgi:hypothetical protein
MDMTISIRDDIASKLQERADGALEDLPTTQPARR